MNVLFNHTFRSIKSNFGQFVLIVLTIAVVTALLFAAITISGLFYNVNVSLQSRLGADADIKIEGDAFSSAKLDEFIDKSGVIAYADKYLRTGGLFKSDDGASKVVLIEAADLATLSKRHRLSLVISQGYEFSYTYPEVWIGEAFASANGIKIGQVIPLYSELSGGEIKLTVTYIFKNVGFFANNVIDNVFVDAKTMRGAGVINAAYLKLSDGADVSKTISEIDAFFGGTVTASPSVDYVRINEIVRENQSLLTVALLFIVALMAFILFTSYLVIAKNRLNELVIFKAVGATNAQASFVMLFEAGVYGLIGAFIGVIFGRFFMGLAIMKVIPSFPDAVRFRVWHYAFAFLMGLIISLIAASAPFIRLGRESVRQLNSGSIKEARRAPWWLVVIASAVFIACIAVTLAVKSLPAYAAGVIICAAAALISVVIPYIVDGVSAVFRPFKGTARLAASSVRRNNLAHMLTALVTGITVFTFIIVSVINIIIFALTPYNERFSADFVIETAGENDLASVREKIAKVHGVDSANYYGYEIFEWIKDGGNNAEYTVYGVKDETAIGLISSGVSAESLTRFNSTHKAVIVSYDVLQRYGLSVGDKIRLTTKNGVTLDGEFTVVGTDFAMTTNDRVMIIRQDDFIADQKPFTPEKGIIFIVTDKDVPALDLYKDISETLDGSLNYILLYKNWVHASSGGISGIITLLRILQILISAVAFVGIVNLSIITMLDRTREFNIYKASGMSRAKGISLTLLEGTVIAVSGGALGLILSAALNRLMPAFAKMINRFVVLKPVPAALLIVTAALVVFFVAVYFLTGVLRRDKRIERNAL